MSLKTQVVAFTNDKTTYIKEVRDMIDSKWVMINAYKTVGGYSYEQVLEHCVKDKSMYPVYGGKPLTLTLKSYEDKVGEFNGDA